MHTTPHWVVVFLQTCIREYEEGHFRKMTQMTRREALFQIIMTAAHTAGAGILVSCLSLLLLLAGIERDHHHLIVQ